MTLSDKNWLIEAMEKAAIEHVSRQFQRIDTDTMLRQGWTFMGLDKRQLIDVIEYYRKHNAEDPKRQ